MALERRVLTKLVKRYQRSQRCMEMKAGRPLGRHLDQKCRRLVTETCNELLWLAVQLSQPGKNLPAEKSSWVLLNTVLWVSVWGNQEALIWLFFKQMMVSRTTTCCHLLCLSWFSYIKGRKINLWVTICLVVKSDRMWGVLTKNIWQGVSFFFFFFIKNTSYR